MNRVVRTVAGVRASAQSFFRERLNLALLVVLPAVSIQVFGISLSQFPESGFLTTTTSLGMTGRITGAVFATGALAGVLGLFQIISARDADRRLSICGFPAVDLLVSRFITLVAICFVIAGIATVTLMGLVSKPVTSPVFVFSGLAIGGITYAMLGILVGSVLPRELEGSLVLVILADMDNVLASGIFGISETFTRFSPLSYPHEIVTQAVLNGDFPSGNILPAMLFVSVFGVLAVIAYTRTVEPVATGGGTQ
ncbi:hypothetical protein [Halolamina sp. C58]|uniref:hypothetical protein n=1 Tax=Halolamina sp. C58 TaxID=3421640 RepID=UPI003EB723E5